MEARILVASENAEVRGRLRDVLQRAGHAVAAAEDAAGALEEVGRSLPHAVLLDPHLSDATGRELLRALHGISPTLPVLLVAAGRQGGAPEPAAPGVCACLADPSDAGALAQTVELALENGLLRARLERHEELALRRSGALELVAESAAMRELVQEVQDLARRRLETVLIVGERGAGKGLAARALHFTAGGLSAPFVQVPCADGSGARLEATLFGRASAGSTPTRVPRRSALELARGGTLFLDDVDALPLELQERLARLLADGGLARAGPRLLAATSADLTERVEHGGFLFDLHALLAPVTLAVPPLRERVEDVAPLAGLFTRRLARELRSDVRAIAPEAEAALCAWRWPGNVRELQNVVERAVLRSPRLTLTLEDLPPEVRASAGGSAPILALPEGGVVLEELEKQLVAQALERCMGNRTRAARLLGMNRDQIRYRIEKFQLERPAAAPAEAAREAS